MGKSSGFSFPSMNRMMSEWMILLGFFLLWEFFIKDRIMGFFSREPKI